jgi:ribosomal protein S18 acetylase RimI-like enzyme
MTTIHIPVEHYPWELLLLADPSRTAIEDYIKDSLVLGTRERDQITGVVALFPLSPKSWEIKNVAVRPSHQGQGIGKKLILSALDLCKDRGASEVWIGTGNSSINQLGLYQKLGFRMVSIDKDFFVRNYQESIFENGIQCRDMVRLVYNLAPIAHGGASY